VRMDSSCELLSSLQQARPFTLRSALPHRSTEEGCRIRLVLLGVRLSGGVCLTEITREPSVGMGVLGGSPCTAVTPTCTAHKAAGGFEPRYNTTGAALTHPHPQSSRLHSKVSLRRAVDAV
jgi:hypothetical protein